MRYETVTDAREDFLNIVKKPHPVVVTRNGQPAVVILPFEEYQQLAALRDASRDPQEFLAAVTRHQAVQGGWRVREEGSFSEKKIEEFAKEIMGTVADMRKDIQRIEQKIGVTERSKPTAR